MMEENHFRDTLALLRENKERVGHYPRSASILIDELAVRLEQKEADQQRAIQALEELGEEIERVADRVEARLDQLTKERDEAIEKGRQQKDQLRNEWRINRDRYKKRAEDAEGTLAAIKQANGIASWFDAMNRQLIEFQIQLAAEKANSKELKKNYDEVLDALRKMEKRFIFLRDDYKLTGESSTDSYLRGRRGAYTTAMYAVSDAITRFISEDSKKDAAYQFYNGEGNNAEPL